MRQRRGAYARPSTEEKRLDHAVGMENATSTWKPLLCLCNRSLSLGKTGKLQSKLPRTRDREGVLCDRHPIELTTRRLANELRLPIAWDEPRVLLGSS
jgi:hypothetical protein